MTAPDGYWHHPGQQPAKCRHPLDRLQANGNCGACGVLVTWFPGLHSTAEWNHKEDDE